MTPRMLIDAVEMKSFSRMILPALSPVLPTAFYPIGAPGQSVKGPAWVRGHVSTTLSVISRKKRVNLFFLFFICFTVGARIRSRRVVRQAVRPHGQCLSELVQRQPCSLSPCYTYSASIIDGSDKVECIRSDGLIVEHGKHPIF